MARLAFFGTPAAAVPTLEALHEAGHEIALVVTQPDRPKGRSGKPVPSPVKQRALERGLVVAQPGSRSELAAAIADQRSLDVGVVVAYGRILGPEVLEAPSHGLVNVHFSLLPRWRGAAPVARALMAGDNMTGVTIIRLDEGLDTGAIVTAQAIDIRPEENAGTLTARLSGVGARLLTSVLPGYLAGEITPVEQTDEGATYAAKVESSDRPIDPSQPADTVVAKVRGLAPDPAATLDIDGRAHKIFEARLVEGPEVGTGTWSAVDGHLLVGVSGGTIELVTLQPPGKTPQAGSAWVNGQRRGSGTVG